MEYNYKQSEVQQLYPQLPKVEESSGLEATAELGLRPSAPTHEPAHNFRLQKIGKVQK